MTNQETSRLTKLRRLEATLWQLGFASFFFTAPIGTTMGYSTGGIGGALIGFAIGSAFSGVILLMAFLITWYEKWIESREDRHN